MFKSLLIANRGEIAVRISKTAALMGIDVVAVYSDADAGALHTRVANRTVRIGPPMARDSYLNVEAILKAAQETGAEAIHPGYGFLSENPDFAEAVEAAGLIWVGPTPKAIRSMGLKDEAKRIARKAGVPVVPGVEGDGLSEAALIKAASEIGYPVLIKAIAGGGGRGIRRVDGPEGFGEALASARREAAAAFGDDRVLLEKLVPNPRHLEVQVFGDSHGNVVHLFERDCSLQRRRQKLVEEAPAPGMNKETRDAMTDAAIKLAKSVEYRGAGTVEFVADGSGKLRPDGVYFLEMNTRLQVEHPVTEMVTGVDLVEWQLRIAAGEPLPLKQAKIKLSGHAIEARIVAEDPAHDFRPQAGLVRGMFDPDPEDELPSRRWDRGFEEGDVVPSTYDSLLAKLIVHAEGRDEACEALSMALNDIDLREPLSNIGFLARVAASEAFIEGGFDTGFMDRTGDALRIVPPDHTKAAAQLAGAARLVSSIRAGQRAGPFGVMDGFRINAEANIQTEVFLDTGPITVRGEPRADQSVAVETALGPCAVELFDQDDDGTVEGLAFGEVIAPVRLERDKAFVRIDGETHKILFARPISEADFAGGDAALAPMPGKVIVVHAEKGSKVTRGDTLAVMEAMKMELSIAAPRDGVVESVNVSVGDQIAEGTALVSLVPE
jgi:3-methylcrotonyl-CoA carboxylase alpha subunit